MMTPKPPTDANDRPFATVLEAMESAPPLPADVPELTETEIVEIERENEAREAELLRDPPPPLPDEPDLPF